MKVSIKYFLKLDTLILRFIKENSLRIAKKILGGGGTKAAISLTITNMFHNALLYFLKNGREDSAKTAE